MSCFTPHCSNCPGLDNECHGCEQGYLLVEHFTIAKVKFRECLPVKAGCNRFDQASNSCQQCIQNHRQVYDNSSSHFACIPDPSANLWAYLGVMIAIFLIIGSAIAFVMVKARKKSKRLVSFTSKLVDGIQGMMKAHDIIEGAHDQSPFSPQDMPSTSRHLTGTSPGTLVPPKSFKSYLKREEDQPSTERQLHQVSSFPNIIVPQPVQEGNTPLKRNSDIYDED